MQDVRMTNVHFCETVETIDFIAYSDIYDQHLKNKSYLVNIALESKYVDTRVHTQACARMSSWSDGCITEPKQLPLNKQKRSPKTDCLGYRK